MSPSLLLLLRNETKGLGLGEWCHGGGIGDGSSGSYGCIVMVVMIVWFVG